MEAKVKLYENSYENLLNTINEKFDIIYIDPPYKTDFAYEATKLILKNNLLNEKGTIIIETDEEERIIKQIEKLEIEIVNRRKYGRVHLVFLEK